MLTDRLPSPWDPDAFVGAFDDWARESGIRLYPGAGGGGARARARPPPGAVSTPTGTGKSLVAVAAHAAALAQGQRSWYTAPIKALVSEKFFALVDTFGAANVGMVTGDSSVNPDAPIICCTAEILANLALREGPATQADVVVMDEFHFYADPDRGWAWQVPLLLLPRHAVRADVGDARRPDRHRHPTSSAAPDARSRRSPASSARCRCTTAT